MGGDWLTLVDEVSVRHELTKGTNWRIQAGRFPSPVGLGMTEHRASTNAALYWCHRPLYMALPSLGPDAPALSLVSAVYPNGVLVSTGAERWDARAAVVDAAPVQFWHLRPSTVSRTANAFVGGGLTPAPGLRLGAGAAWGTVGQSRSARLDQPYVMLNAEGEYAFGYTRISGEWTHDRFGTSTGVRNADGWSMQVRHTVTPRVFVHSRITAIRAPAAPPSVTEVFIPNRFRAADSTLGYLLSPDLTVRVGHSAGFDRHVGGGLVARAQSLDQVGVWDLGGSWRRRPRIVEARSGHSMTSTSAWSRVDRYDLSRAGRSIAGMTRLTVRLDFAPDARLGPGKVLLLETIVEQGSISAAARRLDMSYRRAWLLIDSLNQMFHEPVVQTTLGGRGGGTAALTPLGAEIVVRYRAMEHAARRAITRDLAALERRLRAPHSSRRATASARAR